MRRIVAAVSALVLLAGCSGSGNEETSPPDSNVVATPTTAPTGAGSSSEPMPLRVGCDPPSPPCTLSAGTWVLKGKYSYILGMEFTVPDGWESREQDAGEFSLFPLDLPNDHILMVKDIAAVMSDGSLRLAKDVPSTAQGLTDYWRQDPNLVVSPSEATTVAGGTEAITYVITVSPDAKFADPACPVHPLCADLFTDPRYWDGAPFGIGAPEAVRLYLATIRSGSNDHLFVIGLDGEDETDLERLTEEAAPIIDSIRLPSSFPTWPAV